MKAAVYYGPGKINLEDYPKPVITPKSMLVKVHCCAICGTDLKLATIGHARCHPPRVIGHEMVGSIVEIGAEVEGFSLGERITLATTVACGECFYCKKGLGNVCPNSKPISFDYDGAFAEYLHIPEQAIDGGNVVKVPDSVSDDSAALSEPLSCGLNALELAGVKEGDKVLVIGGGPLGALNALLAQALGASEVMVVQRSEPRLSMLRAISGITIINGTKDDVLSIVNDLTEGFGVDAVIVCAPSKEAQEGSLKYVRKGGVVSLFASLPKDGAGINLDSRAIHYGELKIVGASDSRPEHVRRVVEMITNGQLKVEPVITHKIGLSDIHKGFELMKNKECLKVLVYPQGTE